MILGIDLAYLHTIGPQMEDNVKVFGVLFTVGTLAWLNVCVVAINKNQWTIQ